MKIVILEDDKFICEELKNYFELDGNSVVYYHSGDELLDNCILDNQDIFLLDINVPNKNGFDTIKEIRSQNINKPINFITAQTDLEHLKTAYSLGCNDYIRKPFDLEEVEIRINQLVNKTSPDKYTNITNSYKFCLSNSQLLFNNELVELSLQEKNLLYLLVSNIGNAIETNIIKDYIWDEKNVCDNTLRTKIKKLRAKLKENFIINIRNIGYKIEKYD